MRARRGGRISASATQFIVSLSDPVFVFEGAALQQTPLSIPVTRSGNLGFTGSVDWDVTGSGSNPATAADFGGTFPSGVLNFTELQTATTIALTIHGNATVDGNRTFTVTLSAPSTTGGSGVAAIGVASIIGTIYDDDSATPTTFVDYGGDDVYYGNEPTTYGN